MASRGRLQKSVASESATTGDGDFMDADRLLDALDQMQAEFMRTFSNSEEMLHTYNWNVCKTFWRNRGQGEPIAKQAVIDWRVIDPRTRKAIIGESKARKIVDNLVKIEFLEPVKIEEISKKTIYLRPTDKFFEQMGAIFSVGVTNMRLALNSR